MYQTTPTCAIMVRMSVNQVLGYACPVCGAVVGSKCVVDGVKGLHEARAALAAGVAATRRRGKPKRSGRVTRKAPALRKATVAPPRRGERLLACEANTLFMTLERIGVPNLRAYWSSDHWRGKRDELFASGREYECVVCGKRRGLQAHHLRYDRLGDEPLEDLVYLCGPHHDAAHRAHVRDHVSLDVAHLAVKA